MKQCCSLGLSGDNWMSAIKESPPAQDQNKGRDAIRAKPHPSKLPTCGNELKRPLSSEGNQQQQRMQM